MCKRNWLPLPLYAIDPKYPITSKLLTLSALPNQDYAVERNSPITSLCAAQPLRALCFITRLISLLTATILAPVSVVWFLLPFFRNRTGGGALSLPAEPIARDIITSIRQPQPTITCGGIFILVAPLTSEPFRVSLTLLRPNPLSELI